MGTIKQLLGEVESDIRIIAWDNVILAASYPILLKCSILSQITEVRTKTLFDVNDYIDIAFESSSNITYIGRLSSNKNAGKY